MNSTVRLAPHERLLVSLTQRDSVRGEYEKDAEMILAQPAGREQLLRLALRHGVHGLVVSQLIKVAGSLPLPADVLPGLKANWAQLRRQALLWDLERDRLLTLFGREGVLPVVLKGGALRETVYGNPAHRFIGDLDLLISPDQLNSAVAALERVGYSGKGDDSAWEAHRQYHFHFQLGHPNGFTVELHWALTRKGAGFHLDERAFLERARLVQIQSGSKMRIPSPENMVLHMAAQSFEDSFGKLRRFVDLDRVVSSEASLDWEYVHREARTSRLDALLSVSLRLCELLYHTPVPSGFVDSLIPPGIRRTSIAVLRPVRWATRDPDKRPAVAVALMMLWSTTGWRNRTRFLAEFAAPHLDPMAFTWETDAPVAPPRVLRIPAMVTRMAKLVAYQGWIYGVGFFRNVLHGKRSETRFWG